MSLNLESCCGFAHIFVPLSEMYGAFEVPGKIRGEGSGAGLPGEAAHSA